MALSAAAANGLKYALANKAAGEEVAAILSAGSDLTTGPVANIADPAGGTTTDAEARAAIVSILNALETLGLMESA